ncbi:hypothetical protein F6455_01095 [Proteobacteria bacterium 005FR1]|nr:hypothetical protein [Proteobacteria bacterium 005FR1]
MDYLKEKFYSDLQSEANTYVREGRIHIREMHWSPSEFLESLGGDAADEIMNEWFDERKESLLQIAEEILEGYDNRDRFDRLKETCGENSVIPFVGAGMSIPSEYPGWSNYLRVLCSQTRVSPDELERLLNSGRFEEAAQTLFDDMGAPAFNEHLRNTFDRRREPKGPINYLPRIFRSGVITTNFDTLLEGIYDTEKNKFEEVLFGVTGSEFPRLAATGRPYLLKLHGNANRQRDRVITLNEYESAYQDRKVLRNLVANAFFSKSMLFMGCSLATDRTIQSMSEYVNEFGHESLPQHYAFVSLQEGEDRISRREQLVSANIFPIWYEGVDHDEAIEALLLALVDGDIQL